MIQKIPPRRKLPKMNIFEFAVELADVAGRFHPSIFERDNTPAVQQFKKQIARAPKNWEPILRMVIELFSPKMISRLKPVSYIHISQQAKKILGKTLPLIKEIDEEARIMFAFPIVDSLELENGIQVFYDRCGSTNGDIILVTRDEITDNLLHLFAENGITRIIIDGEEAITDPQAVPDDLMVGMPDENPVKSGWGAKISAAWQFIFLWGSKHPSMREGTSIDRSDSVPRAAGINVAEEAKEAYPYACLYFDGNSLSRRGRPQDILFTLDTEVPGGLVVANLLPSYNPSAFRDITGSRLVYFDTVSARIVAEQVRDVARRRNQGGQWGPGQRDLSVIITAQIFDKFSSFTVFRDKRDPNDTVFMVADQMVKGMMLSCTSMLNIPREAKTVEHNRALPSAAQDDLHRLSLAPTEERPKWDPKTTEFDMPQMLKELGVVQTKPEESPAPILPIITVRKKQ